MKRNIDPVSSFDDLALDSLDALSFVGDLEDEFNISISNDEAYDISSIQEAIALLRTRVDGVAPKQDSSE